MIRKYILLLTIAACFTQPLMAQNYLASHAQIWQKVQEGYFTLKPSAPIQNNNICITTAEAKAWLYLQESRLPTDARMPWYQELIPMYVASCSGTSTVTSQSSNAAYSSCGTFIYNQGYDVNITTYIRSQIPLTNAFWAGNSNDQTQLCGYTPGTNLVTAQQAMSFAAKTPQISNPWDTTPVSAVKVLAVAAAANAPAGPLNRCGLWGPDGESPQKIWAYFPIKTSVGIAQFYYLGLAADNMFRVKIDGTLVINYAKSNQGEAFKIWHIFPVYLTAGPHTIEIAAYNEGGAGAFGAEMYENTPAEIMAATGYNQLKLVFSTKDMIGSPICQ